MDSGLALIVGALIALAGSSLIPWLRESINGRSRRKEEHQNRLRDAVTDLLAATASQAAALTLENDADLHTAFEARTRAASRLLLEVSDEDRKPLARLINTASPAADNGGPILLSLQITLTAWAAGSLTASDAQAAYKSELERMK